MEGFEVPNSGDGKIYRQPIITVLGHVDSGKCIGGESILDGSYITIRELYEAYLVGDVKYYVKSFSLDKMEYIYNLVDSVVRESVDKTYIFRFSNGSSIEVSPEHKFLVYRDGGVFEY
ncbi:TPA: hypothetical protein EYP83_00520, partial [Candidatus Geothermarchaeota archaeon]|nr:hypothetical protein [Candidatus Geothermarchaeota archaeon]